MADRGLVCLDLSFERLTGVEVVNGAVRRWFNQPVPPDSLHLGDPHDPERIGAALKQTLSALGIESRRARIAIGDDASVSRVVEVPKMPARHLRQAVQFLARKELPIPAERACWTWDILRRGDRTITVLLVAAWQDLVDRLIETGRIAGLQVEVIEPRAICIARAVGVERAVVLEAWAPRLQATLVHLGGVGRVEQATVTGGAVNGAAGELVRRMFAHDAKVNEAVTLPQVFLSGEATAELLPGLERARDVVESLNGHPARPFDFPAKSFVPHLGLAMRS